MISNAKAKLQNVPTPMGGLALGIASLGWCWENYADLHGYGQWIGAGIASVLLIILAFKFLLHKQLLWKELAHPVVGSVVPTFAMGVMVVSNTVGQFYPFAGDSIWLLAVALHVIFLLSFIYHRLDDLHLHQMVPSWFVPPVGIIVAGVSYSGNPVLEPVADGALYFGMTAYAVMLPIMIYRFMFSQQVPDSAKPTLAILAAPASLSMAGYLTVISEPSPLLLSLMFGIAVLMTLIIYLSFFKLLRLPFSPGYAAFTFPVVIGSTALFKLSSWMEGMGLNSRYISQIEWLATVELIVATVIVLYVSLRYMSFYRWQERNEA
ncbi:TDT family transporter [Vibrio hannami]|uniref:TDT family transporter n=1 Tax=Vibrio hannami TaxID=2717094 RepID=UPI00240F50A4|nr:TDT family transporter [Vibrio hannami]MDG3086179.1 TDT family transporter [Vibrio hannami]